MIGLDSLTLTPPSKGTTVPIRDEGRDPFSRSQVTSSTNVISPSPITIRSTRGGEKSKIYSYEAEGYGPPATKGVFGASFLTNSASALNSPEHIDRARMPMRSGLNSEIIFLISSSGLSQVMVCRILNSMSGCVLRVLETRYINPNG